MNSTNVYSVNSGRKELFVHSTVDLSVE